MKCDVEMKKEALNLGSESLSLKLKIWTVI